MAKNKDNIIQVLELPENPRAGGTYSIDTSNTNYFTHGFFKYPCKYIPQIPKWAINKYLKNGGRVLDPFCGSGTSLVEASLLGCDGYGIEIDSFGRMLTRVKSMKIDNLFEAKINKIRRKIENIEKYNKIYVPKINNLDLWFFNQDAIDLGKIKSIIERKKKDRNIYEFLNVCLASIIRKISKADEQSPKPYVSKRFPKKQKHEATELFLKTLDKYLNTLKESSCFLKGNVEIIANDARKFSYDKKMDLAVTSPPYINAFDYVRSLRLENLWIGHENEESLRQVKKLHFGSESVVNKKIVLDKRAPKSLIRVINSISKTDLRRAAIVKEFFSAMEDNMRIVYKHLKKGGHYIIVVGDSEIRGVPVITHEILKDIAIQIGFKHDLTFSYVIRNRYLRIPRKGRGGLIKKDWIIDLKK